MAKEQTQAKKRIGVVTGAAGFIGSHLTRRILSDGWDVSVIVLPSEADRWQDDREQPVVHCYDGTVDCLSRALADARGGTVFHLATYLLPDHRPEDIEPMIASNILFGTQLVEAMVANEVFRLVNTGSYAQHYENKDYSPATLYAATKQAFEAILRYYYEATPLKVITLKPFNVYGPGDPKARLFPLLRKAAQDQQPILMTPGDQLVDLIYIDDIVEAFILAAERFKKCEVGSYEEYMLSSGARLKLSEIVELYARVSGTDLPIIWGGRPYREREIMVPWDRGAPLPGWTPKVSLEEGIRRIEEAER